MEMEPEEPMMFVTDVDPPAGGGLAGGVGAASDLAQPEQRAAPGRLSRPQAGHFIVTNPTIGARPK
jgi:hypothetical protein